MQFEQVIQANLALNAIFLIIFVKNQIPQQSHHKKTPDVEVNFSNRPYNHRPQGVIIFEPTAQENLEIDWKKEQVMTDFKIIDCHNHSMPFIDDGAESLEMALEMLRIAQENGTSDVILTPHHLNGAFTNEAKKVKENLDLLRSKAIESDINIRLHPGSEVHLVSETADQIISNNALTYCDLGKAALIELPKSSIPTGVESILSQLIFNSITPIIAHPERNTVLRKNQNTLQEWVEFGCKAQLTGQSCTGEFGASLQAVSFSMIESSLIHLVASDAHRPVGRSPSLSEAASVLTQRYGVEVAKLLLHDNPARLINGQELVNVNLSSETNTGPSAPTRGRPNTKAKRKKSLLQRLIDFQ